MGWKANAEAPVDMALVFYLLTGALSKLLLNMAHSFLIAQKTWVSKEIMMDIA